METVVSEIPISMTSSAPRLAVEQREPPLSTLRNSRLVSVDPGVEGSVPRHHRPPKGGDRRYNRVRSDAFVWKYLVEPSIVIGDLLEAFHRVGELQIHFHFGLDRPLGLFLGARSAPVPEQRMDPGDVENGRRLASEGFVLSADRGFHRNFPAERGIVA